MIYSLKLKEAREEKNITQKMIADILGITASGYERYENEHDIFPIKHLISTCNYLDISLDYIFNFTPVCKYSNSYFDVDTKKVGLRLKEFRKNNKLTQVKLAKTLNIGNGTLADYERGRYLVSTPVLFDICKRYSISADYLLGKIDEPKYLR